MTSNAQAGYATITVSVILAAFSIVAIGYSNLGRASLNASGTISSTIVLDGLLEMKLAETVVDLTNEDLLPSAFPQRFTAEDGAVSGEIRFEFERDKARLADLQRFDLAIALNDARVTESAVNEIMGNFLNRTMTVGSHSKLEDLIPEGLPEMAFACLRSDISDYHIPAKYVRPGEPRNVVGEVVRILVQSDGPGDRNRRLDTTMIFTGDKADPVLILDWRRYTIEENGDCIS